MGNDPKSAKRWYLRCSDCLSVAVVESVERPQKHRCGACDGTWEVLGHVEKNWRGASRLNVGSIGVIPCDSRCTYAQGPSCDCPCGGENHGKGIVVEVKITDTVPRVTPLDPEEARRRAEEYRAALKDAMAKIEPLGRKEYERWCTGEYLEPSAYGRAKRYERALYAIYEAKTRRTHRGRLRALQEAVEYHL